MTTQVIEQGAVRNQPSPDDHRSCARTRGAVPGVPGPGAFRGRPADEESDLVNLRPVSEPRPKNPDDWPGASPSGDGSMNVGFDHPLYILPLDHRGTFLTEAFGWKGELTAEQSAHLTALKRAVYDGFRAALGGMGARGEGSPPRRRAIRCLDPPRRRAPRAHDGTGRRVGQRG